METLLSFISSRFKKAIELAFPDSTNPLPVDVTDSTASQFGDYQCNSPMKLAKILKKSPRDVGAVILEKLDREGWIQEISLEGPGFINLRLDRLFLEKYLDEMDRDPKLGAPSSLDKQKVIVEYSSPNVAKEMHVGHLRSTIIGEAIARLFRFLGHDVLCLNHLGDWGTQFGMLIAYLKEVSPSSYTLQNLMEYYKASKGKFDVDPLFKKQAQLEVVALQSGDPSSLAVWEKICAISREAYQEIYDLLGVQLEERGESFYNPILADIIDDLEKKNLVTLSEGAKCVFVEGFTNREGNPLPLMVQKSDGGYNYDTTDMAAMWHRFYVEKADRVIVVTDAGQSLHFALISAVSKKAGYIDLKKHRFDHVPFGLVLGPDGKKFKTRSGDTEKLVDLLSQAVERAEAVLIEKKPDFFQEERKVLAKKIGIGSVKYADLSTNRLSDYQFSYEKMLRFEGNTAAFLLYSRVRTLGIQKNSSYREEEINSASFTIKDPSERELGLHLLKFGDCLRVMSEELFPNRLTDYLYHLAELFNAFFRDCRVIGHPEEKERLRLTRLVSKVLGTGLFLLGIDSVEKM